MRASASGAARVGRRRMLGKPRRRFCEGHPVTIGKAKNELSAYIDVAQNDRVLITRHGRPAALIIGVEGEESEDLMTRSDPEFWQAIEARRGTSKVISAAEMRKRLGMQRNSGRPSLAADVDGADASAVQLVILQTWVAQARLRLSQGSSVRSAAPSGRLRWRNGHPPATKPSEATG